MLLFSLLLLNLIYIANNFMTKEKIMKKIKLGPKRLLFPMPSVLVGAIVDDRPNFMAVAWCSIAAHKPPALSVSLRKERYTLKGVKENGVFSVNVPSCNMVRATDYCGLYSGKDRDKSKIFTVFYGTLKNAPLIQECPVNLECSVVKYVDLKSHMLVIGEIIETYTNDDCMTDGKVDPEKIDPLIYSPGNMKYYGIGNIIAHAFSIGKE